LYIFFFALGEGDRVPGWIAAWTPNILFAAIGLYLSIFAPQIANRPALISSPRGV